MNIQVEVADGGWDPAVVVVAGELDLHSAAKLRERLDELILEGVWKIVVDLEAVDFIDSSALRVLLTERRRLETDGGTLGLVCTQPRILKILEITGLLSAFPIFERAEEARQALARPQAPST